MQSVLTSFCGFAKKDLVTLTDYGATKKLMESAIANLVVKARKGDRLFIHYSGHGSNVPDDNGDEADHRDEILCPTDLDWKVPFRDDWLRKTFDRLRAGVHLTVVMDCCYSGTNTRAVAPPDAPSIPRFLPSPWDLVAAESGRRLRGAPRGELRRSSRSARRKSDVVNADIPELLITGCRSTQESADAYIAGGYHGALTYYLAKALRAAKGKISYRDLHAKTLSGLRSGGYDQVPQLEGRKERFDDMFLSSLQ
jgi:metacaspase-1